MKIQDSVALVTGANRGLGLATVHELLARGARKVYAAVRDPARVPRLPGVVPIQLDVTRPDDIAAAAAQCGDTTLLVNNAGIAQAIGFLQPDTLRAAREMFETNVYGPILLSQTFAPILAGHGGGAIINILSVASWANSGFLGPYGASKAAAWGFTNGLRAELRAQGTQVLGLHVGFIDTDLTKDMEGAKISPEAVAAQTLAGLEDGLEEVLADDFTRAVKAGLSATPSSYLVIPPR